MTLPALNPLQAPAVICPTCGGVCPAEPVRVGSAKVTEVRYSCINPEKDCSWEVKATLQHITGEGPFNIKPKELEQRREQAAAVRRFQEIRENSLSELVALLPKLKGIVRELSPAQVETGSTGTKATDGN